MPEFMSHPPEWLLSLLWVSFFLVVLRLLLALVPALPLYIFAKVVVNAPIRFGELLGMQVGIGTSGTRQIVLALILASTRQLGLSARDLRFLHHSGGNVKQAVAALARIIHQAHFH
jgi:uncharacterized protein YqfA (UPF0365 family)